MLLSSGALLRQCAWILGCCFVVWRPLSGQEQLPAQAEFIEICSRNDYQTLGKLLHQHSKNAVQAWLTTPVISNDYPLHACARSGCTEVMQLLLAHQADPDQGKTSDGATPFYVAAQNGYQTIIELLLKAGADPNLACSDGATPLFAAALNGYQVIVELLLKAGADPNQACSDGATSLFAAAFNGYQVIVELLLKAGADPDQAKYTGVMPLYVAAQNGHQAVTELLLKAGAAPNQARTRDGATPLYVAAQNDHQTVVELLLKAGADPNQAKYTGVMPLYIAAQNGHQVVTELLLKAGAAPNHTRSDGSTPLYVAAQNGHQTVIELLLKAGVDPGQTCTSNSATPLYVAAQNDHQTVVELLLKAGADPGQAITSNGATPLHIAARNGHTAVVATLSEAGPVSPMDFHANTPLHNAVRSNHPVVVVLLLQAGADPSLQNTAGLTALSVLNQQAIPFTPRQQAIAELLQRKNHHRFVRWLRRWIQHQNTYGEHTLLHEVIRLGDAESIPTHANDLETPRLDGCTPLHLAVLHRNAAAVATLVIQGVNLSPLDLQNETPLQLALQNGHEPIINILGPAVMTVSDGASMDSNEVFRGHAVDQGLLSGLPVFSLQSRVANALRRWLTLDEIRALFESGVLSVRLYALVSGVRNSVE